MSLRYLWFRGDCPCCERPRVDLIRCVCGCPTTGHATHLKRAKCERCTTCKAYEEAPGQVDAPTQGAA